MKGRKTLRRAGIVLGFGALLCAGMLASGALGMTSGITGSTDSSSTATDTTASTSTSADTTGSTTTDTTPPPTTTDTTSSTTTTTPSVFTPSLSSDQADYAPGATVTLTGSGWPVGDAVHVTVDDSAGQSWSYTADVTADLAGNFTNQFQLPNWFVATYTAAASDATGLRATASFTDSTNATAVVNPKISYRNTTGNVYTFSVTNTGTTTLNFVRISPPNGGIYSITACSASGWSGSPGGANQPCDLTGGTIAVGATGTFQATASLTDGANDTSNRTWDIRVSDSGSNSGGNTATQSPAGSLAANAYVFEIEDAVIATTNPTINANCPSANKSAIAGTTRVVVICGRNHIGTAQTPTQANSALGGTMIASAGTFNSGSVAANSSQSKVLAYYSGATITSSVGTGRNVTSLVGATPQGGNQWTSPQPSFTLTGYEATPTAFTITASAGTHGSISPSGAVSVNNGASQAFTITPDATYHVAGVLVDGSSVGAVASYTFNNVTASHTIAASFAINTYTVTPSVPGGHGSLSPATAQTVNHGDTTAFTATPATGYHIDTVSGCGGSLSGDTFTTGAITGNCTVTASFAINVYSLSYAAGDHGSLTGDTSQSVNHGSDGSAVTAVPATGYHFVKWSDDSTANPRTDTNVTGPISVTASFAINVYSLTYSAGDHGSLTGDTSQSVNHGSDGSAVTAVPATGYHFVKWSDDSTANPRTDTNVTGNISVTASFAINQYTLTYSSGLGGSLTGSTLQTVNHGADGTAVTAVPNTGYHFVNWSDSSTANPRTDTNVTGNKSVTASFAINTYSLAYTSAGHGTISGSASQTVNYGANGSAVTAVPDAHYHFVQWSDGVSTASRTDTNVTANVSVSASFAIDTFTLTYTAGANGSITGSSPQTVGYGSDGSAVTATPNSGYHFVKWSDDSTANPRTDTNVTGPISVTASFAVNNSAPSLSLDAGNDLSVNEGSTHTYAFTISDPDVGDTFTFVSGYPTCGTGGTLVSGSGSISNALLKGSFQCTFPDGVIPAQTTQVKVKVKDASNAASNEDTQTVTVANVSPTVATFGGPNVLYGPLVFGLTGSFSGTFTDPGLVDYPWTASFTWGGVADTDPTHQFTVSSGNGTDTHSFTARPTFTSAGCNKEAIAKVTDKDGGWGTKSATVQVGTGEFLAPVSNTPVTDKLKNGQVLPVKVRIADCNGNPITGLAPTIALKKGDLTDGVNDDSTVTVTPDSVSGADTSGVMRAADGYYIYNMKVSLPNADLGITPYTIIITPGITGYVANMQLRHKIMATK
jgi:uncharacterized repeat protein (TIGR02543 family)